MEKSEIVLFYCALIIKYDDIYYCKGGFGRFLDEISKRYKKVIFCAPVKINADTNNLYKILSSNIEFQELPPISSFVSALKKRYPVLKAIKRYSKQWNSSVYLRWPTPFVYKAYKLAKKRSLPVELHIVGDTKTIISDSGKYKGIMKSLALCYINILESQVKRIMRESPTIVNGSGLRRLYQNDKTMNVKEIRSATLSVTEFDEGHSQKSRAQKLLSVGALNAEKGVKYLLDAIKILTDKHLEINLTIVGDGPQREFLENYTDELGIARYINFMGYVPLGEKLIEIYKNHDIFVLPSISEGTPRVLIEAMANKLAIVATNAGGIPYTITDHENGIMVEPKSAEQIADAIENLINDNDARNRLIDNGYRFAKENTIEKFVDVVCEVLD